jgi:hypothetical protein
LSTLILGARNKRGTDKLTTGRIYVIHRIKF